MILNRRKFVAQLSAAALGAAHASGAVASGSVLRKQSHLKGPSLTSYSLKPRMRWWKGERGEGDMDMFDFLEYCARLQLDAAELTSYFFPPEFDSSYSNQLRRRAHLLGIDLSGGAMGNNFTHAPPSPEGQQQLAYARKWIDHFGDMGIVPVRIFAGNHSAEMTAETALQNVIDNIHEILPHAERRGVMLGVENHDFTTNLDRLLKLMAAIDSEWLGVTWDSANLAPTPTPYCELMRIAPYAITAQIKVSTKVNDEWVRADFPCLIRILRNANFRGYVVLEYEESEEPFDVIPGHLARLRAAITA